MNCPHDVRELLQCPRLLYMPIIRLHLTLEIREMLSVFNAQYANNFSKIPHKKWKRLQYWASLVDSYKVGHHWSTRNQTKSVDGRESKKGCGSICARGGIPRGIFIIIVIIMKKTLQERKIDAIISLPPIRHMCNSGVKWLPKLKNLKCFTSKYPQKLLRVRIDLCRSQY